MPNEFFDDLYESMQQAEAIAKGEMQPASVTRYEIADVEAIKMDGKEQKSAIND